jgi:hypothetical protein
MESCFSWDFLAVTTFQILLTESATLCCHCCAVSTSICRLFILAAISSFSPIFVACFRRSCIFFSEFDPQGFILRTHLIPNIIRQKITTFAVRTPLGDCCGVIFVLFLFRDIRSRAYFPPEILLMDVAFRLSFKT